MIIDFHTHTFPDAMAPRVMKNLEDKAGFISYTDGTMNGLKESMKKAGVDISVLLPVVTNPKQTLTINNCAIENNKLDGIISFGGMHPDFENYEDELKRLKDNGIKGIKLHPDYQGIFIDDERCIRIVDKAFEMGLIVIIHAGIDYGFPEVVHATPERIISCLEKLENKGVFVLAHMGYTHKWDYVVDKLKGYDVYFDLALSLGKLYHCGEYYDLIDEKMLLKFVDAFGENRILFATDSPWADQKDSIDALNSFNISDDLKEKIFSGNAKKLLHI